MLLSYTTRIECGRITAYQQIIILLVFLITLPTCGPEKNTNQGEVADRRRGADAVLNHFTAQGFNEAGPQWNLKADQAYIFSAKKLTYVVKVDLVYFQGKEGKTLVTCDEADIDENEQTLLLRKNVVVKSDNGRVLYAEELLWREKEQFLVSEKPVKITMPSGDIIEGQALTADNRLNRLTLKAGRGFHPMPE